MVSRPRRPLARMAPGSQTGNSFDLLFWRNDQMACIDYIMEQPGDLKYLDQVLVTILIIARIYAPLVDG